MARRSTVRGEVSLSSIWIVPALLSSLAVSSRPPVHEDRREPAGELQVRLAGTPESPESSRNPARARSSATIVAR